MRRRSSFRLTLARGFPFIGRARTLAVKAHRTRHTHGTSSPRINGSRVVRPRVRNGTSPRGRGRRDAYFLGCVVNTSRVCTDDNAPSLKTLVRFLTSRNVQGDAWVAKNYDRRCEMHESHRWLWLPTNIIIFVVYCQRLRIELSKRSCMRNVSNRKRCQIKITSYV